MVNELIKANKDFDLLLLPNRNHGFGNEPYMVRRRWDYFVRYLLGGEPPQGYEFTHRRRRGLGRSKCGDRKLSSRVQQVSSNRAGERALALLTSRR